MNYGCVWLGVFLDYKMQRSLNSTNELLHGNISKVIVLFASITLTVALPNGRPCENRIIEKEFSILKEKAGLPNVVFHSLRHSSTTYKLNSTTGT